MLSIKTLDKEKSICEIKQNNITTDQQSYYTKCQIQQMIWFGFSDMRKISTGIKEVDNRNDRWFGTYPSTVPSGLGGLGGLGGKICHLHWVPVIIYMSSIDSVWKAISVLVRHCTIPYKSNNIGTVD